MSNYPKTNICSAMTSNCLTQIVVLETFRGLVVLCIKYMRACDVFCALKFLEKMSLTFGLVSRVLQKAVIVCVLTI